MQNSMRSNCCKGHMYSKTEDEGTSYWVCGSCGKACNSMQKEKYFTDMQKVKRISKKIIKQAVSMANLSQWIQMEIHKYENQHIVYSERYESIEDLADKIIKRVLEYGNRKS